MTLKTSLPYIVALGLILGLVYLFAEAQRVGASAPSGLPATVATTSQYAVSSTAARVFATSTCAARVVSTTGASGIMIGFSDSQGFVPTGALGHWQGASTTVTYDSGQFGCSAMRIYSGAAQTITVMESR